MAKIRRRLTDEGIRKMKPPAEKQTIIWDSIVPRLFLAISYGGTKTFRTVYYVGGKPRSYKLGRFGNMKIKEARNAARHFLEDPDAVLSAEQDRDLFGEVVEDYLRRYVKRKGLRSAPEIDRCLRKYVLPDWADKAMTEITRRDVSRLLDRIEDEHGPAMADKNLAYLSGLFRWYALRSDDFNSPIIPGMGRNKPSERARKRILDDDEIRALWTACGDAGTYGACLKVLLLTGQRRAKVATMRWDDISDDGVWTIRSEPREKNNPGTLELPPMVMTVIEQQPVLAGNEHVFAGEDKGPVNSWSAAKKRLDKDMPEGTPPWVVHDIRRTARSLLSRAGVRPDIAERVLGHQIGGVEGVYDRHDYAVEKRDALVRLASVVQLIVNPPKGNVVPILNQLS